MNIAVRLDFPYLTEDRDRHGNLRIYVRRGRHKVRIREPKGSGGFARAYSDALDTLERPTARRAREAFDASPKGTFGWLAAGYFRSRRFAALAPGSRATRRLIIEDCLREPREPGARALMAACPLERLTAAAVMMLMDRKADKPGAANNRKKYLSALFGWAVKARLMTANPARDAERATYVSDGFYTWTVQDVRRFWDRHPVGTKAHVALALLLFTGARRGDVVTFGPEHTQTGALRYVPLKTSYRRRRVVEKPIFPILARALEAGPVGTQTFLETEYGKPFTAAGFGGWFRKRCDEAGLPKCTAHGLKKAGATIAADNGATLHQLMAMFDWTTVSQAEPYTRAADQKRLAVEGSRLMVGHFQIGDIVPPLENFVKDQ